MWFINARCIPKFIKTSYFIKIIMNYLKSKYIYFLNLSKMPKNIICDNK